MEESDLSLMVEWRNNINITGIYNPLVQTNQKMQKKRYEGLNERVEVFIIKKKDNTPVGCATIYSTGFIGNLTWEIGFMIIPTERSKGFAYDTILLLIDYIFLSKNTIRIQARTDNENLPSRKILEKAGFFFEGCIRKDVFIYGKFRNTALYSILREEWKNPKILNSRY